MYTETCVVHQETTALVFERLISMPYLLPLLSSDSFCFHDLFHRHWWDLYNQQTTGCLQVFLQLSQVHCGGFYSMVSRNMFQYAGERRHPFVIQCLDTIDEPSTDIELSYHCAESIMPYYAEAQFHNFVVYKVMEYWFSKLSTSHLWSIWICVHMYICPCRNQLAPQLGALSGSVRVLLVWLH